MTQTPQAPAGWYPQGGVERWWDGVQWTDCTRPVQPAVQPPATQPYQAQPGYTQPMFQGTPQTTSDLSQPKSNTTRNVLIVFGVFFLLLVGGCVAGAAVLGHKVDKAINDRTPCGPRVPLTIRPGQAFSCEGFDYAAGWSVGQDDLGDVTVTGLTLTNHRGKTDQALVTIKLRKAGTVLAQVDCNSGSARIPDGESVTLDCVSSDSLPTAYDEVTIQDDF